MVIRHMLQQLLVGVDMEEVVLVLFLVVMELLTPAVVLAVQDILQVQVKEEQGDQVWLL